MAEAEQISEVKARLVGAVDRWAPELLAVSHEIHAHPELCFEEHFAHGRLTDVLEAAGLAVTRSAYGLDTAFAAEVGERGPCVAVICEYDALPDIGHACGHNIIAAAGLGAALAAAELAQQVGGRVRVLGTPAEEGGGGKVLMAEQGAFEGVDAAMMVHPAGSELRSMTTLAIQQVRVRYNGEAAHAAAAPHRGRNALDAAVQGYTAVAALRQHIRPDERIHGIFTEAGEKPNIVPRTAAAHWYVRSPNRDGLAELKERVLDCLRAGAIATGCTMEHHWVDPAYDDMVPVEVLVDRYAANAETLGRHPGSADDPAVVGSTDMGNISHLVPSIHPMIKAAPTDVAIHTPAFAEHAVSATGDQAVIDGAKAMAMTVADLWLDEGLLDDTRQAFARATGA